MKLFLTIVLLMTSYSILQASSIRDSVVVYFRKDYSALDLSYRENETELSGFIQRLDVLCRNHSPENIFLHIQGAASPDGLVDNNRRIAVKRSHAVLDYLLQHEIAILPEQLTLDPVGVDWDFLKILILNSDVLPQKEKILSILENIPETAYENGRNTELRKYLLSRLDGGTPYREMYEAIFPLMRRVVIRVLVREDGIAEGVFPEIPLSVSAPWLSATVGYPPFVPLKREKAQEKFFRIALRTNLLEDAILIPNLGLEMALGRHISLALNWRYAWWSDDRTHWYWRIYGGELELRCWLGDRRQKEVLQGHHIGIYGQMLTYDFEAGCRGWLGDRWSFGAGLSYGYALRISDNLNLDFSLGLGYLEGIYEEYLPMEDCYVWQVTRNRKWLGPTKLEVALVWLIR